jgi:hypothetical protein
VDRVTAVEVPATLPENTHWVDGLLQAHPELAVTAWRVTVIAGLVSVEVSGAYHEAQMWHAAVGGRIFPSLTNAAGVRRQSILSRHVTVEVIGSTNATRTGLPLVGGAS